MLSEQQAHEICDEQINKPDPSWPNRPEIVITKVEERPHSWVYYYQSEPYVEGGDPSQSLIGNGPCVVLKSNGKFAFTATYASISDRIDEAEVWLLSQGAAGASSVVAHS
jgi:hypothetical protein